MIEKSNPKRILITGGTMALTTALLAGGFLFGNNVQASSDPVSDDRNMVLPVTTLSAHQNAGNETDNAGDGNDAAKDETGVGINNMRARWNGDQWEYSTDGGETWTDTPPEGVKEGENGGLTFWQGEGDLEDSDLDNWEQEIDSRLESLLEEVNDLISDTMPEGYEEWGSFFSFGSTIARQTDDGQWEFSDDSGETWTDEAPEGFSVNEDGTRFRIGGDEDWNDFNYDDFMKDLLPQYNRSTSKTVTL